MSNFLRMDMYRLLRSKSFWIILGCVVAVTVIGVGMLWWTTTPEFAASMQMSVTVLGSGVSEIDETTASVSQLMGSSILRMYGSMWIGGGALAVVATIFVAIFCAGEFENGFAKNIFTSTTNRVAFFCSKAVVLLFVIVLFALVSFGGTVLGAAVLSLPVQGVDFLTAVQWIGLVILLIFAIEMLVGLTVWFSRKMVAAILVAVFISSGLISGIFGLFGMLFPIFKHVPDFLPTGCLGVLTAAEGVGEPLGALHIALVGIVFLALFTAGSVLSLKKKDI